MRSAGIQPSPSVDNEGKPVDIQLYFQSLSSLFVYDVLLYSIFIRFRYIQTVAKPERTQDGTQGVMNQTGHKVSYLEYEIDFDQFCYLNHNKNRHASLFVQFHSHFVGSLNCRHVEFLYIIFITIEGERERERDWYMSSKYVSYNHKVLFDFALE